MISEIRIHPQLQKQLQDDTLSPQCYPDDSLPAELLYILLDLRCVENPHLLLFVTHLGTAFVRQRGFDCAVSSAEDGSVWLAIHASSLCEVTHNIATGVARHLPRLAVVLAGVKLNATIYSDRGTYQVRFEEKQPCTPILNQPW